MERLWMNISQTRSTLRLVGMRDLLALARPTLLILPLMSALVTARAAGGQWVDLQQLGFLALAGVLAAGGAAALNQYYDRDLDSWASHLARRPLPSGRIATPLLAAVWGLVLCGSGLVVAGVTLPIETALLIALGVVIYLLVYSLGLKRITAWSVLLLGLARACPVLAGWTAVRADWPLTPLLLAALVFFWTPANYWAYALIHTQSYQRAGLLIFPDHSKPGQTPVYMLAATLPLVLLPQLGLAELSFWIASLGGLMLVVLNLALWHRPSQRMAQYFYAASNYYFVIVFLSLLEAV